MGFKIKGLDELQGRLKALSETSKISLGEVLSPEFMASCSRFTNVQELFDASGFPIRSVEDLQAVPDDKWDAYINSNTSFADWASMQQAAHEEWLRVKFQA